MEIKGREVLEGEVLVLCKSNPTRNNKCINKMICEKIMKYKEMNSPCSSPFIVTWTTYLVNKNILVEVKNE